MAGCGAGLRPAYLVSLSVGLLFVGDGVMRPWLSARKHLVADLDAGEQAAATAQTTAGGIGEEVMWKVLSS